MRPAEPIPAYPERFRQACPDGQLWKNDRYTVVARPIWQPGVPGRWVHLSVRANDRGPIHDWRHLQQIKNDICGPLAEGLELYPAEDRLLDTANQYHLFVLVSGGRLPYGFHEGRTVSGAIEAQAVGGRQRDPQDQAVPVGSARLDRNRRRDTPQIPKGP